MLLFGPGKQYKNEVKKMGKTCVECGDHVPAYLNYLCESCWRKALNEKLDKEKHLAEAHQINIESPANNFF